MGWLQTWLTIALAASVLLLSARLCQRRRSLPRLPLRLPMAALLCWGLWTSLPLQQLPAGYRLWLGIVDDLLLCFASLRLLVWSCLELPGGLGWWHVPPKLLVQLISAGGGTVAAVLVVRQTTRFDLVNLLATSAVLTAVIGLAAQEGLKDLFSGIELQATDDFHSGDWLELADGRRGTVVSISWRETRLRTIDGCILVVPNSKMTSEIFVHRSSLGMCSDRFELDLAYDFAPGRALKLLLDVIRAHPLVLVDPPAEVRVQAFQESSIRYELQVWQRASGDRALLELRSQLLLQIWYAVRREGQNFPVPIRAIQRHHRQLPVDQHQPGSLQQGAVALGCMPIFADLSDGQRQALVADSRVLTFGPGEAVVREGAEGDSLYCLLRGRVDVVKAMADGRPHVVRQLSEGDVFGEMTLFLDAPRSATVRTVEECQLLQVARPAIRTLLEANPALLERFVALVRARQAELSALSNDPQEDAGRGLLETMKRLFFVVRGGSG
jgi:small-conductance mechanosensitive channel/CRP-like cAMP-binding protein